jgi:hypothetical protein
MRWIDLFADLEGQAVGLAAQDLRDEIAERTRIEAGRLTLAARLGGALGCEIEVRCVGAGTLRGRLGRVGAGWLLLDEVGGTEALVPAASVLAVSGLGRWSSVPPAATVELGLRSALRRIVRDRAPVRAVLIDGAVVAGTVDRVGVDFVEIAEHPLDLPRRAAAVTGVRVVPFGGVGVVRRR